MVRLSVVVLTCVLASASSVNAAEQPAPLGPPPLSLQGPPQLRDARCTGASAAEQAYCRALKLSKTQSCRTGSVEERLECLERKLALQAEEIESLSRFVQEFTTPSVKPLGMTEK